MLQQAQTMEYYSISAMVLHGLLHGHADETQLYITLSL